MTDIAGQPLIYVIGARPEGPNKIGISSDLNARLRDLQVGNPDKISLWFSRKLIDKNASKLEAFVHRSLKPCHRHGEWFDISVDDAIGAINSAFDAQSLAKKRKTPLRYFRRRNFPWVDVFYNPLDAVDDDLVDLGPLPSL